MPLLGFWASILLISSSQSVNKSPRIKAEITEVLQASLYIANEKNIEEGNHDEKSL